MATKYPLLEPLDACTEDEINAAFEYLDKLEEALDQPITLNFYYEVSASFSGGEANVIFESWKAAKDGVI